MEIISEGQGLKHPFSKLELIRNTTSWLETLGIFGMSEITPKPGMVHVLGDALLKLPTREPVVDNLDIPLTKFSEVMLGY